MALITASSMNLTWTMQPVYLIDQSTLFTASCLEFTSPSLQDTTSKLAKFMSALKHLQQDQGSAKNNLPLKSLKKVFKLAMEKENPAIKQALYKPAGYWMRFFTKESWDEWVEQRTKLGIVIHLAGEVIEGSTSLAAAVRRLNMSILKEAVAEARVVLKNVRKEATTHQKTTSCASDLLLGAASSLVVKHPAPLGVATLSCLQSVAAERETKFQGTVSIPPGETWYNEANRKIAVCKRGTTAWDDGSVCNYGGPDPHVTVTRGSEVLYDGTYGGSNQWFGDLKIQITNKGGSQSDIYVHVENEWADLKSCWGFC